jgi:hypothetical protein
VLKHDVILLLEAVGGSGIASIIVTLITARLSGGKQNEAQPNGVRTRLQDEVIWLRQQLAVAQLGGFAVTPPTAPPPEDRR